MPNNDHLKDARQMIDDLINDDPEASKKSFHDFLKAKTVAKLNPEMDTSDEDEDDVEDDSSEDEDDVEDDSSEDVEDDSSEDDDSETE